MEYKIKLTGFYGYITGFHAWIARFKRGVGFPLDKISEGLKIKV